MFRRVQARHYKMLRNVDVRLESMNILVGPNASGKSTLLDVFSFLQDALENDVEEALLRRGTIHEIVWRGENVEQGFEIAVEMSLPEGLSDKFEAVRYELHIGWHAEVASLRITNENLFLIPPYMNSVSKDERIVHPLSSRFSEGVRKSLYRSKAGDSVYQSELNSWKISYLLSPFKLSLSGIPEDRRRFPVALWFRDAIREQIKLVRLDSTKLGQFSPPGTSAKFQPDGSNLPVLIDRLAQTHPDRFEWWVGHMATILPDLKAVHVREHALHALGMTLEYQHGLHVPSYLLSDGTLRMMALTLIAYLDPDIPQIYMIEEPENGVHPMAIENIFDSLSSVYTGQVFVATHSPLFLGFADPHQLLVFTRTEDGDSRIVRGSEHPMLEGWRRDRSLSSLMAEGVLG
jgi:predicted ATPase